VVVEDGGDVELADVVADMHMKKKRISYFPPPEAVSRDRLLVTGPRYIGFGSLDGFLFFCSIPFFLFLVFGFLLDYKSIFGMIPKMELLLNRFLSTTWTNNLYCDYFYMPWHMEQFRYLGCC
jgi:hypothetical protein